MSYWKCVLIIAAVALSVFVRAATFAQRNLPVFSRQSHSALVVFASSDAIEVRDAQSPDPTQTHSSKRGPVSFEKIFVRLGLENFEKAPFLDSKDFAALAALATTSYVGPNPSRPPST